MSEGMEPASGSSGGGRSWRKADYPDKLMELQTMISGAAAGGNLDGMFYGAEMLVSILGPCWDFTDEELMLVDGERSRMVIRNFRDYRRNIEKDWDKVNPSRQVPSPERIFKTIRSCWQLIDEVVQPLVKRTPVSRSKFYKKDKSINTEDALDTSEATEGVVP